MGLAPRSVGSITGRDLLQESFSPLPALKVKGLRSDKPDTEFDLLLPL
jgi:hypothetical protein